MLSNMKTKKTIIAVVVALLAVSVASSRAQTLDLTGGTLKGSLTGQTLIDSGNGNPDGQVSSWVVSDSSVDPSGLIFIYQLENSGPDDIAGLSFNDFSESVVTTPTSGTYSSIVNISLPTSVTPSASAGTFTFEGVTGGGAATFSGPVGPVPPPALPNGGTQSLFVVVYSDVNSIAGGYVLTQDNFQAYGNILAPLAATNPVPEPSSVILLTGGILCFYAILRCRRAMS